MFLLFPYCIIHLLQMNSFHLNKLFYLIDKYHFQKRTLMCLHYLCFLCLCLKYGVYSFHLSLFLLDLLYFLLNIHLILLLFGSFLLYLLGLLLLLLLMMLLVLFEVFHFYILWLLYLHELVELILCFVFWLVPLFLLNRIFYEERSLLDLCFLMIILFFLMLGLCRYEMLHWDIFLIFCLFLLCFVLFQFQSLLLLPRLGFLLLLLVFLGFLYLLDHFYLWLQMILLFLEFVSNHMV